jgi:X-Pro dipeptidyl-peptidase
MRMSLRTRLAASAGVVALLAAGAPAAMAADEPAIVVQNGVTQPVFGFADAITERIAVVSDIDTDNDGALDVVSFDIKRPKATAEGLKAPVIMDASPYYATSCRGNEAECKEVRINGETVKYRDANGNLTKWPLYYDNYFVPRGYAVLLLDMIGTGESTGCPTTGGPGDNMSAVMAIDWLNGRRAGTYADGSPAVADWHNGKTGMIGKSYDGTLANAAAATGVEGLETIVPISAISSWYDYSRTNGIRHNTNYAQSLSNTVTTPSRRAGCAAVRAFLSANDRDESGDYTDNTTPYVDYWADRDYNKDFKKITASVFVVHGINDFNVRTDQMTNWWESLEKAGVERKLWVTQTGHIDPFDFRRAEWVKTIHRWFDHELFDVQNGIMDEPMVDFERSADVWETLADWPAPEAEDTRLWFRTAGPGEGEGAAGGFGYVAQKGAQSTVKWQDTPSMPRSSNNPAVVRVQDQLTTANPNKVVFMSDTLTTDLRISGAPSVQLTTTADQTDTNYGAVLVDLGTDTRVNWSSGDGIRTLGAETETCWGESTALDDACYRETAKNVVTADRELVSHGIMDALNRFHRSSADPLVPGEFTNVNFDLIEDDYIFKAGHKIAIVLVGSYSGYSSVAEQNRANITVDVNKSRLTLPIVGGQAAARAAGL